MSKGKTKLEGCFHEKGEEEMELVIWIVYLIITVTGGGLMLLIPVPDPIRGIGLSVYRQVCTSILCIYIFRQYLCKTGGVRVFRKKELKCCIWAIVIGVGICLGHRIFFLIFKDFVERSFHDIEAVVSLQDQAVFFTTVPGILYVTLLGPVTEEIFFRGIIFPVARQRRGNLYAIMISSLLFAVMHFNGIQFISALFMGVVVGYAVVLTDNVYIGVVIHVVNNAFSLFNANFLNRFWGSMGVVQIAVGIILLLFGCLMLWRETGGVKGNGQDYNKTWINPHVKRI